MQNRRRAGHWVIDCYPRQHGAGWFRAAKIFASIVGYYPQIFLIYLISSDISRYPIYYRYFEWRMLGENVLNLTPPGQNGRHFADDILRCILLNEKSCILFRISLKFVLKNPIANKSALIQVMAWRRSITWTNAGSVYWRIYAALGGDELILSDITYWPRNWPCES